MIKVLTPFGPAGRELPHWNLCLPDEMIGTFGTVCTDPSKRYRCGCGMSFLGIRSKLATTRGIVSEREEGEVEKELEAFYQKITEEISYEEMEHYQWHMNWLFQQLDRFPVGQILLVEKTPVLRLLPIRE